MPIIPPPLPHEARYTRPISSVVDLLRKVSYKPGWKITIHERVDAFESFDVVLDYEGYESTNAAFEPIVAESWQVANARERIAVSIGKHVRREHRFRFTRQFYRFDLQNMNEAQIIEYVIGGTIKQVEMYEFERWFKYEGIPIFEKER
jgi:hypothetical protein